MKNKFNLFEGFEGLSEELEEDLVNNALPLDSEELKAKVLASPSDALCEIIVCDRYFGGYEKLAIACMEELGKRRINGENFDFETYIDNSLKDLPVIDFKLPNISDAIKQMISMQRKK